MSIPIREPVKGTEVRLVKDDVFFTTNPVSKPGECIQLRLGRRDYDKMNGPFEGYVKTVTVTALGTDGESTGKVLD